MRLNPETLLEPNIGDIVHNFLKDEYYLIVESDISWDNIKIYNCIFLNNGSIQEIGYWHPLFKTNWEIVA